MYDSYKSNRLCIRGKLLQRQQTKENACSFPNSKDLWIMEQTPQGITYMYLRHTDPSIHYKIAGARCNTLILSFVLYIQILKNSLPGWFFPGFSLTQGYPQGPCLFPSLLRCKARAFQESQDGFVAKELPVEVAAGAKHLCESL